MLSANRTLLWTAVTVIFLQILTYEQKTNLISSTHKVPPIKSSQCKDRSYGNDGFVCVCDETYCDSFEFDWQSNDRLVQVQSSLKGKRFYVSRPNLVETRTLSNNNNAFFSKVHVDLSKERQSIIGFGGAFTDAAVININDLPSNLSQTLLESYFGNRGLQYTVGRVPISGTDFSTRAYSYDDTNEPDYNLERWSLALEDEQLKIPFIKKALSIAGRDGRKIKLFASSWSPPKWMKDNGKFARGHLKNSHKIYRVYADYLMKFFDAYQKHNINFWGATVQNEPIAAYFPFYWFNSLQFNQIEQQNFISQFLGPALEARGYNKTNFKLIVGDDIVGLVNLLVPGLVADKNVQNYVSGVAFHWYLSGIVPYSHLSDLYHKIKDKIEFMIMSEACTGSMPFDRGVRLGSWRRGESYAEDIIEDLTRYTSGWVDWNLALDAHGTPNWAKNFVDAPIIVNKTAKEFYKQPMYYALGHFSKFFHPGDLVVESLVEKSEGLMSVAAFRRETKHVIINLLNTHKESKQVSLNISQLDGNFLTFNVDIDDKSINTFIFKIV